MTKTGTAILKCGTCGSRIHRSESESFPSRCLRHLCRGKLTVIRPRSR